jgi:hypothetical protein
MNATSIAIRSAAGGGIGPLNISDDSGDYDQPFPIVHFQTIVAGSEPPCQPNGVGCVVPPVRAQFYPFFALGRDRRDDRGGDDRGNCALLFGNFSGPGIDNFGGDTQYGAPNLAHGPIQNTSGPVSNPCIPRVRED